MADPTLAGGNKQDRELQEQLLRESNTPPTLETLTTDRFDTTATAKNDPSYDVEPDADAKTIAGSDQFGSNAVGTNEQNFRIQELASQGQPTPQMANDTNEMQSNAYTDGNSAEAQKRQYDLISSGQGGLLADLGIAEPMNSNSVEAERKKRENTAALLAAAGSFNELFAAFKQDFDELNEDASQASAKLAAMSDQADIQLEKLNAKITELETLQNTQEKDLARLKLEYAEHPGNKDYYESEIRLKEAEIANTQSVSKLYREISSEVSTSLGETRQKMGETQRGIDDLNIKIKEAESRGNPEELEALRTQLAAAQTNLESAKIQIEDLGKKVEFVQKVEAYELHKQSMDCASTPQGTTGKAIEIETRTKLVSAIITAAKDGTIDQNEIKSLASMAKKSGVDKDDIAAFATSAAEAGLLRDAATGQKMNADQATQMLLNEWDTLQKDISNTETKIDVTEKKIEVVEFEQANLQAKVAALDNEVAQMKDATLKLEQQTAGLERDAASVNTVLGQNATEFTYMFKNYSLTGGLLGGESMGDIGKDAARYLRDSGGNPVYVNPSDQTLFTLKKETDANGNVVKDENGNPKIARDADGKQIMVPIAPLEELKLRNDLYEGKLIFANNVSADLATNTVGESSEEHGAGKVLMHSLANKSDTVKERLQGALDAEIAKKAAMDQQIEQNKQVIAAQNKAIHEKEVEANMARSALASHKETLAQQHAQENILLNKASASGVELPQDKTDSSKDSKGEATTNLTLATPKYSLEEAAEMKSKIDNVVSITPEGIEKLKADAAKFGISEETVEDTLKANKVEIKDNQYANAPSSAPTAAPAPSNLAYFPLIGKTAEVAPITVVPFKPDPNNIYAAANMSSFADSDAFTKYNAPNSNPTYMEPINNKTETAPVAKENFFEALTAKDPVAQAAEAARIRMEEEAALRMRQEQLLAARTNSNVGMSGGGTQGA